MQNYSVSVQLKVGGNDEEDCILIFSQDDEPVCEMTYHWMGGKDATKDFGKLPKLIERMENVLKYGDSTYRTFINSTQVWISGNKIRFCIHDTHYSAISLKINESLVIAYKKVYNWYMKYRTIYEASAPPVMLVENPTFGLDSSKYFGSSYKTITYAKDKLPEMPHPPYVIE